jgi:hypothetical protein
MDFVPLAERLPKPKDRCPDRGLKNVVNATLRCAAGKEPAEANHT